MNPSLKALVVALLRTESDESTPSGGELLDKNYGVEDFDSESLRKLQEQFQAFILKAEDSVKQFVESDFFSLDDFYTGSKRPEFQVEHDYIMTVNRNGCGFWEKSDWEPRAGAVLTDLAHQDPEIHAFTENGTVYLEFG